VLGAWSSHDVRKGRVFDGLVLDCEAPVVLALVFAPAGHLELFQEEVRAFPTLYRSQREAPPERRRDWNCAKRATFEESGLDHLRPHRKGTTMNPRYDRLGRSD
jgi:hypothetical protein